MTSQNRVLEKALYSGGLLSQGKKRHRDEMSRLVEQDQQLLRQENERLQMEVRRAREDLLQSRETVTCRFKVVPSAPRFVSLTWSRFSHAQVRQLDASVLSLSQSSAALEQENAALKRELAAQKELSSVRIIHTPKRSPVGHIGAVGSGSACASRAAQEDKDTCSWKASSRRTKHSRRR